jgi:hypothetical protein
MRHITWLGLLVGATAVGGTAYKSVGPDGTVVFSDRPTPSSQELRLPEPSTYAPPALPARPNAPAFVGEQPQAQVYDAIRVTAPPHDGTVFASQGGVDIDVMLDPSLMEGHTLSYIVDGKEMAKGLRANRIRITDLDRGTHHLEVAVRDASGSVVGRSARITFHLRQSSLNDPLRPDDDTKAKPEQQPTYKPPSATPSYTPPTPSTQPYVPPVTKQPYQPPGSTTNTYPPPTKAPSFVPTPPARAPYAPSYTPK